jgi:hypothetical protein
MRSLNVLRVVKPSRGMTEFLSASVAPWQVKQLLLMACASVKKDCGSRQGLVKQTFAAHREMLPERQGYPRSAAPQKHARRNDLPPEKQSRSTAVVQDLQPLPCRVVARESKMKWCDLSGTRCSHRSMSPTRLITCSRFWTCSRSASRINSAQRAAFSTFSMM